MTRRILSTLAAVFVAAAVAGPAWADDAEKIALLEQAKRSLEQPGIKVTALQQAEINKERAQIEALIQKLRSGQKVDPKELDRLIPPPSPWRD